MSAYVTLEELQAGLPIDLAAELAALPPALVTMLLEDASQDVDRAIGGPRDPITGRAVDPLVLALTQIAALKRATIEAAAFRLSDAESIRGATEYTPAGLALAWRGVRPPSPAVLEALEGHGLIVRSGLAPDPDLLA